MAAPLSQVFSPSGFQELFSAWKSFPDAVPYAGGIEFIRNQGSVIPMLPKTIISLDKLEELRRVRRTERYLEIGAMVKLNQIINLGRVVPEVLIRCLECIASPQLRNLATIGGNLCSTFNRLDCAAVMVALEAQFELRTAQSVRWVPVSHFLLPSGPPLLSPQELLTRIRIPLEPWTFTYYYKLHDAGNKKPSDAVLFVIKNEKNILTGIRAVYSGQITLRQRDSENILEGKRLPLDRRDASAFIDSWETSLAAADLAGNSPPPGKEGNSGGNSRERNSNTEFLKKRILNFIETSIMRISD